MSYSHYHDLLNTFADRGFHRRPAGPRAPVFAPSLHQRANQAVVEHYKLEMVKLQLAHATLQTSADAQTKHAARCTILRAMRGA
jgi:hypothetical protein